MAKKLKAAKSLRSRSYKVAGRLSDGVSVLEPKTKPTHFTSRQIRGTISDVLRRAKAGGFGEQSERQKG
jgi:hypothetical protein